MAAVVVDNASSKRPREEETLTVEGMEDAKRHRSSFTQILSLLEEEEEEPTQDLSSLITTLQQELSSSSSSYDQLATANPNPSATMQEDQGNPAAMVSVADSSSKSPSCASSREDEEDDERERVMRHLLEASDDELGIPNRDEDVGVFSSSSSCNGFEEVFVYDVVEELSGVDGFCLPDGLWEFEDVSYCGFL